MISIALIVFVPALAFTPTPAQIDTASIPYANFQPKIDGDLSEWRAPTRTAVIAETALSITQRNQVQLKLAWNLDALLIAGSVNDNDLFLAPAPLVLEQFCQYDALQLYIDPQNDSSARMNGDDIDLIMLPDGRSGVLRGDDLVASLLQATVPQRQSAPLAYQYASQIRPHGWAFELSIPFAALAKVPGVSGYGSNVEKMARALTLDFAMHDLLANHPPEATGGFSASEVGAELRRIGSAPVQSNDVNPENALPAAQNSRKLWPLSWTGERDLGYPSHWRAMQLRGDAPFAERVLRTYGAANIVLMGVAFLLLMTIAASILTEWHARRRLRRLLRELPPPALIGVDLANNFSEIAPAPLALAAVCALLPAEQTPEPLPDEASVDDVAMPQLDARDRAFAEVVLTHVRSNLHADLSPAALAAAMHTSLRSLQRRLRAGMNTTPQDLVLAARLEIAHRLLSGGELRVSEVAFQVGFDDLSHFSKRFRGAYGLSPSQLGAGAPLG